jgi:hypothetical protein
MEVENLPVPELQIPGQQFITDNVKTDRFARDASARDLIIAGNIPSHMRSFCPVTTALPDGRSLTLYVLPDYLCIGTDSDYVRVPMQPLNAQAVADALNCILPTTKIVDLIWSAAVNKLMPLPWGPPYDASMMSTSRISVHNSRISAQLAKSNSDATALTAGHKKDVVITTKLVKQPKQVAIYGWTQLNGKPIQPLYLGHESSYADYSHGIRLLSRRCEIDGIEDDLFRVLSDPELCSSVSSEGTVLQPCYVAV